MTISANAQTLTGLTVNITGNNLNAAGESNEPAHWNLNGTASSVWYKWTPTATGLATVDTVGSNFDTVLAVYTGTNLASLTRLTQDDDRGGGRTSLVTFAATAGTTYWIVGVTYGAGKFVAVADHGLILLSADGSAWTPAMSSGTAQRMNNVIYADGKFVAVGEAGTILTSLDADVWTPRISGVTTWLHGLAYNASLGHFATCGQNGVILFSPDGATWTRLPVTGLTVDMEALVAVDSYAQFVAIGHNGTAAGIHRNQLVLKTGETIETWSGDLTATGTSADFEGLAVGAGALFATGSGGKVITATSDKGPWYDVPSGAHDFLLSGLFYNDTLYIVGADETVLQSDPIYSSRLRNISTRGEVGTGANIMISGFVVEGTGPKQVLVRAAGPTLASSFGLTGTLPSPVLTLIDSNGATIASNAGWSTATNAVTIANTATRVVRRVLIRAVGPGLGAFGVAGTLAEPQLELYNGKGLLHATAGAWGLQPNADEIRGAFETSGAFKLTDGGKDSAMVVPLLPGNWTVQVSGANNGTGVAIIEVYALP